MRPLAILAQEIGRSSQDARIMRWWLLLDLVAANFTQILLDMRAKSRRAAAGRAELLANFFGGAVRGVFRENANCGDPPGTLPVPCT